MILSSFELDFKECKQTIYLNSNTAKKIQESLKKNLISHHESTCFVECMHVKSISDATVVKK